MLEPFTEADEAAVHAQLGRVPRGVAGVAHRCPCGKPAVLATEPRLPDGTPFPTTYYLTCPRATAAISTLESDGRMAEMTERLSTDAELAAGYRAAHQAYLADRQALGRGPSAEVPEIDGISAGGMPDRVKCLHALAAHSLAAGPGVNPVGDEAVAEIGNFWQRPCLTDPDDDQQETSAPGSGR
ncbi:DUF501 domain-containing protein [Microlunatus soli]|uniref:DUF501 domain-containing protein n=1 Tax=Microlunatus soli TaxID=630515 RepID=A0A1H1QVY7_9ACTN|nr:DUF501 domain-containing protein [Microlunatus soli]SDS27525.1 hypothetical protein SAMN04489812_1410 [Microlunatus soli]